MLFETPRTLSTQSLFPYRKSFLRNLKVLHRVLRPVFMA